MAGLGIKGTRYAFDLNIIALFLLIFTTLASSVPTTKSRDKTGVENQHNEINNIKIDFDLFDELDQILNKDRFWDDELSLLPLSSHPRWPLSRLETPGWWDNKQVEMTRQHPGARRPSHIMYYFWLAPYHNKGNRLHGMPPALDTAYVDGPPSMKVSSHPQRKTSTSTKHSTLTQQDRSGNKVKDGGVHVNPERKPDEMDDGNSQRSRTLSSHTNDNRFLFPFMMPSKRVDKTNPPYGNSAKTAHMPTSQGAMLAGERETQPEDSHEQNPTHDLLNERRNKHGDAILVVNKTVDLVKNRVRDKQLRNNPSRIVNMQEKKPDNLNDDDNNKNDLKLKHGYMEILKQLNKFESPMEEVDKTSEGIEPPWMDLEKSKRIGESMGSQWGLFESSINDGVAETDDTIKVESKTDDDETPNRNGTIGSDDKKKKKSRASSEMLIRFHSQNNEYSQTESPRWSDLERGREKVAETKDQSESKAKPRKSYQIVTIHSNGDDKNKDITVMKSGMDSDDEGKAQHENRTLANSPPLPGRLDFRHAKQQSNDIKSDDLVQNQTQTGLQGGSTRLAFNSSQHKKQHFKRMRYNSHYRSAAENKNRFDKEGENHGENPNPDSYHPGSHVESPRVVHVKRSVQSDAEKVTNHVGRDPKTKSNSTAGRTAVHAPDSSSNSSSSSSSINFISSKNSDVKTLPGEALSSHSNKEPAVNETDELGLLKSILTTTKDIEKTDKPIPVSKVNVFALYKQDHNNSKNPHYHRHHRGPKLHRAAVGLVILGVILCVGIFIACTVHYNRFSNSGLHRINSRTAIYTPHEFY